MLTMRCAVGALLVALLAAAAGDIKAVLDCPSSVEAGARPRLDLRLENTECEARGVRILSTVVCASPSADVLGRNTPVDRPPSSELFFTTTQVAHPLSYSRCS